MAGVGIKYILQNDVIRQVRKIICNFLIRTGLMKRIWSGKQAGEKLEKIKDGVTLKTNHPEDGGNSTLLDASRR